MAQRPLYYHYSFPSGTRVFTYQDTKTGIIYDDEPHGQYSFPFMEKYTRWSK